MIKVKIKKTIGVIVVLLFFLFIFSIIPSFEDYFDPNITTEGNQLIFFSDKDMSNLDLNINLDIDGKKTENFIIKKGFYYKNIIFNEYLNIKTASKKQYENIEIYFKLGSNIIKIPLQSTIEIQVLLDNKFKLKSINKKIQIYSPIKNNSNLIIDLNTKTSQLDENITNIKNIIDNESFLKKQKMIEFYGGDNILLKTIDDLIRFKLWFLNKIYSKKFEKNLNNYNNFKSYINKTNNLGENINLYTNKDKKETVNINISDEIIYLGGKSFILKNFLLFFNKIFTIIK